VCASWRNPESILQHLVFLLKEKKVVPSLENWRQLKREKKYLYSTKMSISRIKIKENVCLDRISNVIVFIKNKSLHFQGRDYREGSEEY
jgi:hypothetical protein